MSGNEAEDEAALHFDLTSRTFDPRAYIRRVYADATHVDMERTLLRTVDSEAANSAGALKDLIRDSMGTFIDCKEAMDVMYANDTPLFTGEALDSIADAFKCTVEEGERLVASTVGLFEKLRDCKLAKEMLEKLMVVWHVPGAIYEYCGARVPQRRPDTPPGDCRRCSSHRRGAEEAVTSESERESDASDRSDSDDDGNSNGSSGGSSSGSSNSSESGDGERGETDVKDERRIGSAASDARGKKTRRIARGALEKLADGAGDDYALQPGEELIYWYGTPLARRPHHRDHDNKHSRDRSEGAAKKRRNYEAAVLSLRRAMLYLEENYDLEHAKVLGVATGDNDNVDASVDGSPSETPLKNHGDMTLTYRYALALLRAALFLNEMMAEGLRQADATDTVLIEDTILAMMDTAIATVKLRHFCWTVQSALQPNATRDVAMLSLRRELRDGGEEEEEEEGINVAGVSWTSSQSGSHSATDVASGSAAGNGSSANGVAAKSLKEQRRSEHPVEYYVRITRNQYTRMMEETALRLGREAKHWRRKFVSKNTTEGGDFLTSDNSIPSRPLCPVLFGGADKVPGDLNDSFSLINTVSLNTTETLAAAERTVGDCVRISDFGVDVTESNELKHAETILEAFRTPEGNFARFTTFSIGGVEMSDLLESSTAQLVAYSSNLLRQLKECTDVSIDISVSAADAKTFSGDLFAVCMDHLELVVVSYWSGIAAAVHAGAFDFQPDPNSAFYRMLNGPAVLSADSGVAEEAAAATTTTRRNKIKNYANLNTNADGDRLPHLTYIPVIRKDNPTLRQLSVEMVRRSVKTASDILYALLLSSVNRTLLRGFVHTMAAYRVSDIVRGKGESEEAEEEEYVELHAAILVEVILAQWEKAMTCVSNSVRRMKMVIGESCTSASVVNEAQAQEVGELLEDLEQLRSSFFRCYTHGVGMLAKAYLTLLPSLRATTTAMAAKSTVAARISCEFVSSVLVNKLLNLLSVVIDRTAPFLQRFDEVYDGIDLFAAKVECNEEDGAQQKQEQQQQKGRRAHMPRRKSPKDATTSTQLDPVTALMAECNRKMVLDHVAEQEEVLMALVANLLLVFVDALHHDCQRVSLSTTASCEMPETVNLDSVADALCLPTAVVPIVVNELVSPCVLQIVASLSSDPKMPQEVHALLSRKEEHFRAHYILRVEEHCHLVLDAMLNMLCAMTQQRLTREVHAHGFMMPMMDWQRVSAHTAGAVRPYIADSILLIARAREGVQVLRQPLLDAAITQRLVAHLALAFVTAVTSDGNAFEISLDCSANFLIHGLLLIEAEARTILGIVDALVDAVAKNSRAGALLPELRVARDVLCGAVTTLQRNGTAACEAHAGRRTVGGSDEVLTARQRGVRCEKMVQDAMLRLRSIVEAITTHVDDATIAAAFQPLVGSVTECVAERLGKRKEGYRLAHTVMRQQAEKRRVKVVVNDERRSAAVASATPQGRGDKDGGEDGTKGAVAEAASDQEEEKDPTIPRAMRSASVLQRAAEQEAKRVDPPTAEPVSAQSEGVQPGAGSHDVHPKSPAKSSAKSPALEMTLRAVRNRRSNRNERASGVNASASSTGGGAKTRRFRRTLAL